MITIDKVYKDMTSKAEKTGKTSQIANDDITSAALKKQEMHNSYWNQYPMKLKKEADIKVNNEFVNEPNIDQNKLYLSE